MANIFYKKTDFLFVNFTSQHPYRISSKHYIFFLLQLTLISDSYLTPSWYLLMSYIIREGNFLKYCPPVLVCKDFVMNTYVIFQLVHVVCAILPCCSAFLLPDLFLNFWFYVAYLFIKFYFRLWKWASRLISVWNIG